MVAAQLDVSVGQALIRLRAYAFGNDRPLAEVAEDVVARKLRFDAEAREKTPPWVAPPRKAAISERRRSYHGTGPRWAGGRPHGRGQGDWRSDV